MKNRIIRVFKLLSVLLISLVVFSSVYAQEISLKDVKIVDKNIEIEDPVISGNEITNEINFNEVGNFVTFEITIQNNDSYDYTINNIEDNNKNKNISFSYIYSKTDIKKNSEYKFKVTVLYKNRLENVEEINLKDTKITINLIREDGKESNIVVNPTTGDSILKYILLLIIVLVGIVLKQKKKVFYKVLFIIPILLLPFVIFANESYKQEVIFKDIKVKGVMLPYEVTIKVPGEEPIVRTITYGDEIGELPEVSVDGYDFNGWQDSKGNPVDEHTKVTEEMEISPKLSPIIYTITYDLQGGTATGNKETYTVETDTFTLVNPSKRGYSFSGWTGSNGETLQTEVTVYKGTTGNLSYKAHYRQTENIPYKVIHRKQKLSLDGYDIEEEQTGHGSAGTTVRPETRQYEGFTSPEEQDLLITEDGLASLTYDYNRIIYSYVVDSNTNSTIPSGDYPYGTEATITANNVPGYTFEKWSDGETANPRNIIISAGTTNITPVYKANEDTAYTVIHYQMDIDGVHYTEYERENKTGTTGEEVTPLPKTYEGFTSPSPKTAVIEGDGSTVVEYQYRRNDITIIINIPGEEPIEKTVKYDDVIGELPTPSKDGYTFDGYEDGDGNPVDENTKVHGEMTITPVFSAIEYTISYDLNGGLNHSENPDKYTIESNNIILKDASRNGYTFIGWTGSNGTTPQKNVVIEKGTTGNKNYKANFSKSADTLDITLDVVSYPYDGTPKTPTVTVKDGETILVEGDDYTVEYSNNTNAGEATVKVTMTGSVNPDTGASYEGEKEVHFTILAVPPLVELINTSKEYTGEPIVFTEEDVRITPASGGEISFKYCTDETCEHEVSSIEEAGTYYVIAHVSANGNYSESDSEPTIITIERKEIDVPEVTSTFTYTGNEQELLRDTEYYTVTNNIAKNAGTYDVIVTPTNNYKWSDGTTSPKIVTVTINPYDINNGSVVPVEEYTYDGEEKKPTPSVLVPIPSSVDTTTLTSSDVDYTYENNINAGEAAVLITGKGNYTGTITKTFTIDKADGFIELSRTSDNIIYGTDSISVDVLNSTGEIEANTTTSGVQVSVNGNTITITGLSSIDSGETVNIKVKAKTSTNYKEAEETYSITVSDAAITGGSVTITGVNGVGETLTASVEDTTPKATYTYEWYRNDEDSMSGGTKIDGETSNTYTLTNDDIGKYIYVVVTASKQNYTPITFKDKVDAENNKTDKTKIEVEMPVSTNTCKNLTYNGDTQILTNESGEGYAYINNSGVNAGEYTVEARLEENYMWSDYTFNNKPVTCVINKKNVTIKADNQTKVYDGTPLNADTTCTDKNSDLISGHLPVCTSTGTITNVGNETKVLDTVLIKQNEIDLTNNYNITKENGDLSVTTRDITCTSSSNTKVYDGQPLTDNTGTCTNLVPNQTATFNNTGTATNVSDTVEGNNTLESVTITDQDSINVTTNYNIAKHNGTLTITRANSTCEITNNPVLYYPGDNTGSITYACTGDGELSVTSSSNVITVSNVTRTSSALTSTNIGTSTITVSKAEGPNYNSTSAVKEITVNASIYHVIFDKNDEAATGVMDNQDITYGVPTALNENQYSKSGYVFIGWNTEPDGTGTPYSDKQEVTSLAESGNVTLYAEWIEAQAMFIAGSHVRTKMGVLAGGVNNITSFAKSNIAPDISQMTDDNIVSVTNSPYNVPIYMWYDNGAIYWWSEDNTPSLNPDSSYMFDYLKNALSIDLSGLDTTTSVTMSHMFSQCNSLTELDLSNLDTSNVTDMQYMFDYCSSLTSLDLGEKFNTSKVTDMSIMFSDCHNLVSIDFGDNFDTSNVTRFAGMFGNCRSLKSIDLTKFDTSGATGSMNNMFYDCYSLTTLDLSPFDTKNVTDMSNMFYGCHSLTELNLSTFDTSSVTNMSHMFNDCPNLQTLDISSFNTNKVTDTRGMFSRCGSLKTIYASNSFDISHIYSYSDYMFYNDYNIVGGLGTTYNSSKINKAYAHIDGGVANPGYFTSKTGWRFVNSTTSQSLTDQQWSYFENGVRIESGWHMLDDLYGQEQKYYFVNGVAHLGWLEYEGDHYYLSTEDDDGNGYVNAGAYRSTIKEIDNKYYRFDSEGRCTNYDQDLYLIRFNANGGTASEESRYVDQGDSIGTLPTATRTNYIFNGWWTDLTGGVEVTTSTVPTSSTTYFARWTEINTIEFDSNGGEFSDSSTTNTIKYYDPDYYDDTEYKKPTKSVYIFVGWNEEPDGSGVDTYQDETEVLLNSNSLNGKTLYAQWVEAKAMFDTGSNVNIKMKKLAGASNPSAGTTDTNVTSFERSSVRPDTSSFTSDNIVSISNVTYNAPIYAWYDNGTMYWYTDDERPDLNMDSSSMFLSFKGLESLYLENVDSSYTTTLANMFNGDTSLQEVDLSSLNTSNVTSVAQLFDGATSLKSINISNWDMSNITATQWIFDGVTGLETVIAENATFNQTSMLTFLRRSSITTISVKNSNPGTLTSISGMFYGDSNLVNIDFTNFDTSNITNMSNLFSGCSKLTSIDLSQLDTSKVTNIEGMFSGCSALTSVDFTGFDASKVTNMNSLFSGCSSITSLDLSSFRISSLTSLRQVFNTCTSLKQLNISNWDMSNVTDTYDIFWAVNSLENIVMDNVKLSDSTYRIFYGKTSIKTISMKDSDAGSATTMASMFYNLSNLESLDLRNFDSKNVTNMNGLFSGDVKLSSLNITNFKTTKVTDMGSMFYNCSLLTELDLSTFTTTEVTDMSSMFYGCKGLTSINLSNFSTPKLTSMAYMFNGCTGITELDLSTFDTGKVTNFYATFQSMTNLTTLNISNWTFTNSISDFGSFIAYDTAITNVIADNVTLYSNYTFVFTNLFANSGLKTLSVRNINLINVTSLNNMFYNLINLESLDFTGLDTTGVTNFTNMFGNCQKLTSIDVSSFDTSQATSIANMFSGCTLLETLDLSSFDTSNVTDMNYTFMNCTNLKTIYASSKFVTTKITNGYNQAYSMFYGDTKLVGGLGTPYNPSYVYHQYAHLDGGTSNPGYFTAGTGWRFVNYDTSQSLLDQEWSYYENGERVESGFRLLPDLYGIEQKYYFVNGIAHLGWLNIGDDYYYLSTEDDDGNGYVNAGAYRSQSKVINGKSYAFDADGKCLNYTGDDMYTIIYNANGGTASYSTKNLGPNEALGTLPTATRTNYIFLGWWTDITSGVQIDGNVVPNAGLTYYAHWSHIDTVTFDSNQGEFEPTVTTNTIKYSNGSYMDSTLYKEPTRTGFIFAGWNTEDDGTGTSYADEQAVLASTGSFENEILYAQWMPNNIEFDNQTLSSGIYGSTYTSNSFEPATNGTGSYIYSIESGAPEDASIDNLNRTIILNDDTNAGIYNIVVKATDYYSGSYDTASLTIVIEKATPVIILDSYSSTLKGQWAYFEDNRSMGELKEIVATIESGSEKECAGTLSVTSSNDNITTVENSSKSIELTATESGFDQVTQIRGKAGGTTPINYSFVPDDLNNYNNAVEVQHISTSRNTTFVTSYSNGEFKPQNIMTTQTSQVNYKLKLYQNGIDKYTSVDHREFEDVAEGSYDVYAQIIPGDDSNYADSGVDVNVIRENGALKNVFIRYRVPGSYEDNNLEGVLYTELSLTKGTNVRGVSPAVNFGSLQRLSTQDIAINATFDTNNYMFDKWIVNSGNVPADINSASTTVSASQNTSLTATAKSNKLTVSFDANGGTGTMNDQIVQYNVSTPLNTNTYTRSGYIFNGWNTLPDGTGTSFSDGANIQVKSLTMLYAQWIEDRPESATFDTGQNVVTKMKKLADGEGTYISRNQTIRSIKYTTTKPDISLMNSDNILSSANSESEIYSWYENQTIYIYSNAKNIYLNEDSSYMFCNLTVLTNLDLSSFNTSRVTNMLLMFSSLTSITSLDLSSFDTRNVTNMQQMFSNCTSLTSLNLSSFNTSNVTNMLSMFSTLTSITSLDLSSFNTRKVLYLNTMFSRCNLLRTIYASNNFVTTSVTNGGTVFYGCTSLKGGAGTSYNSSYIDKTYARIDGGTSNPGYFTYKASPTGGNISRFINAFKPKNLLTNKFILLGEVLAIITIGSITFVIMHKQRKKIK